MSHLRNIKEMLSIPTGSRNAAASGFSICSDSQLFFGSQFWPGNSQSTSQDMSLSSRTSQQSSQEGSDPKFSSSYHTKPLLFGDLKDKTKAFGILDKFEEDKNKAKERHENNVLAKEFQHIRETLKDLFADTEKNTVVCQTILEKFDSFASTMRNNLNSLQRDVSKQFEMLLNKINSQREMMSELEDWIKKGGDCTAELGSNLQSLKQSLREEQEREGTLLGEALKLLSTLVSEHVDKPRTGTVTESGIQTSPVLGQPVSDVLPDNELADARLARERHDLEPARGEVPAPDLSCATRMRKCALRSHRGPKKRPLVPSKKRRRISDENSPPVGNVSVPLCERPVPNTPTVQDGPTPLNREARSGEAAGCLITPFSCWSQDSNNSTHVAEIEPALDRLPTESLTEAVVDCENFWELFDMDCDSDVF